MAIQGQYQLIYGLRTTALCLSLQTRSMGEIKLCFTVNNADIMRALLARIGAPQEGAVSGNFLRGMGRLARKIARARLIRKAVIAVNDVLRDPRVAGAVGIAAAVIPGYGPAIGAAYTAATAATTAIRRAQAGDPRARENIRQLVDMASQGSPQAQQAMSVMGHVYRGMQQGGQAAASGATTAQQQADRWMASFLAHPYTRDRMTASQRGLEAILSRPPALLASGG